MTITREPEVVEYLPDPAAATHFYSVSTLPDVDVCAVRAPGEPPAIVVLAEVPAFIARHEAPAEVTIVLGQCATCGSEGELLPCQCANTLCPLLVCEACATGTVYLRKTSPNQGVSR